MSFDLFTAEDFEIFHVPDFAARMPLLRAHIKPKLIQMGEVLCEPLSELVGEPLYPHVAQHLRRTVNPPEETWVAFAKERRAYKPYVHYRVAINAENVRVTVFVEDYAEEKEAFARGLDRKARTLAGHFAAHESILAYHILDRRGEPMHGKSLNTKTIRAFSERMQRIKGQHAVFGVPMPKEQVVSLSTEAFQTEVLRAAQSLLPLYHIQAVGRK